MATEHDDAPVLVCNVRGRVRLKLPSNSSFSDALADEFNALKSVKHAFVSGKSLVIKLNSDEEFVKTQLEPRLRKHFPNLSDDWDEVCPESEKKSRACSVTPAESARRVGQFVPIGILVLVAFRLLWLR